MDRIKIHMPLISLVPLGLGVASLWVFFFLYSLTGYLICPNWQVADQAPKDTAGIYTYYNETIYVQTQSGKILCNKNPGWKECSMPTYLWDREEAPEWMLQRFEIIPENQTPLREVVAIFINKTHYFALLENDQILTCSTTLPERLDRSFSSGVFLIFLLPIGTGLLSTAWWFNIFIKEGYPVIWDWWGRGKPLK
ncbi:MAG: hypothetical protein J0M11_10740 [Anaerolineae bacterium]|nr:hypothetical protein [Anaerolineae bacterium]